MTSACVTVTIIIFYVTFVAMMVNNLALWYHIKGLNLTSQNRKEGIKHLTISIIFAVSFLYRAIYNSIRGYTDVIDELETKNIDAWCVLFFGLHFFGELLPLFFLFWF